MQGPRNRCLLLGPLAISSFIATLEQVSQTVPDGKLLVIELKSKRAIVPVLAEQLKRLDTGRFQVLVIAFDQATAAACKECMPATRVHWLTKFEAANDDGSFQPTAREIADTVKRLGVDGVGMRAQREVIDADFASELRQGGCNEFHVWTVDAIDDAKYFQSLGAIGITTNRPGEVGRAIRKQP